MVLAGVAICLPGAALGIVADVCISFIDVAEPVIVADEIDAPGWAMLY